MNGIEVYRGELYRKELYRSGLYRNCNNLTAVLRRVPVNAGHCVAGRSALAEMHTQVRN